MCYSVQRTNETSFEVQNLQDSSKKRHRQVKEQLLRESEICMEMNFAGGYGQRQCHSELHKVKLNSIYRTKDWLT